MRKLSKYILMVLIPVFVFSVILGLHQVEAYPIADVNVEFGKKKITNPSKQLVIEEIKKQSEIFGVDTQKALDIAFCESTYNYKAKNPNSTARGVYQYLIGTWEETESAKQGKERNDYQANIREAMLDMANGEWWRWKSCL